MLEEKQQSEQFLMQLCQLAESMRVLINPTNYDYAPVKGTAPPLSQAKNIFFSISIFYYIKMYQGPL